MLLIFVVLLLVKCKDIGLIFMGVVSRSAAICHLSALWLGVQSGNANIKIKIVHVRKQSTSNNRCRKWEIIQPGHYLI